MPKATALPAAAAAAPAAQPDLPDELLEDIFVLLDDAADLARASAASTSFRRIISGRRFLRRFRSLHPPPVLGILSWSSSDRGFYPAQAPHSSAPAGHAFSQAADFAFSFLPDPSSWEVRDVRDGRVLFSRNSTTGFFKDLVVCDPLHRRHFKIPPIPGDLVASTGHFGDEKFDPFLAPASQEEKEPSSIQVMCNVMSTRKRNLATFLFSSVTGEWRFVTSIRISDQYIWMKHPSMSRRCYAYNCLYWICRYHAVKVMIVLDMRRMKFSVIDVPLRTKKGIKTIVELAEGRLGLFILGESTLELHTLEHNAIGSKDWQFDHVVPLPNCCRFFSITIAEGYVLVQGFPRDPVIDYLECPEKRPDVHYCTVEIKTLSVERLCTVKFEAGSGYLYASFPPSLSLPSI